MTANLLLFALVGLAEWLLAIWRLRACVAGYGLLAALLVIAETCAGLWAFREFAAGNNLVGFAYALGGGLGTWLGTKNINLRAGVRQQGTTTPGTGQQTALE